MTHLSTILWFLVTVTVTITKAQEVVDDPVELISTLDRYSAACPGEIVVYTCKAIGTELVKWTSPTLIGIDESIQFSSAPVHEVGLGMVRHLPNGQDTFAQLINKDNGTIITELRVVIPEDADDSYSLLVICREEDMSTYYKMSNHRVASMVNPPHINPPIPLHYDSVTGRTLYNISWNPPQNEVFIDIAHYELYIGSLNYRLTSDTYVVVEIMNDADVAVNVTVVDRCNRRQSTAMTFPPMIPDTPVVTVTRFVYGYIIIGFVFCLVAIFFIILRMILYWLVERLPHEFSPILRLLMVSGAIVSIILLVISLCLLMYSSVYQQERNSSFQHSLIFPSLLSSIVLVAIELVGMMVLVIVMYTRLRDATKPRQKEDPENRLATVTGHGTATALQGTSEQVTRSTTV